MNGIAGLWEHLSEHRGKLYGIAALAVILFHAMGQVKWPPLEIFAYGYIGVDIFLLIGSFCLCYSIQKYSTKEFYLRRFLRIYPLWFIVAIVVCPLISYFLAGGEYNILKLGYGAFVVFPLWTGRGGCDWFTASLLHYYLLFPLFWKISRRIGSLSLLVIVGILCFIIIGNVNLLWTQNCGISKLPIFIIGIVVYDCLQGNVKNMYLSLLLFAVGFIFSIVGDYMFLKTAMICPFVVLLLLILLETVKKCSWFSLLKPLDVLGAHSMESYYGGWLSYLWSPIISASFVGTIIYVSQTLMLTTIWSVINHYLSGPVEKIRNLIESKLG